MMSFVFVVGKQTRSRVILGFPKSGGETCPNTLWETLSCNDGPCVSYSWHASKWMGEHRDIWCESSDGVKVTGKSFPEFS